jgi:probable rRNA maturation factor
VIVDLRADVATRADRVALVALARRALRAERVGAGAELSILLTGDRAIRRLNREHRRTAAPTDVLSFAQAEGRAFAGPAARRHLGDVVISVETARRQAREYGVTLQAELSHLLVHGILHLLGYDHVRPGDARNMRHREDAILGPAHHH